MPDLLDRIRSEIRERLEASRRAVDEYGRLEQALRALDDPDDRSSRRAAPRAAARSRRGARSTATQRQANRARLLAALDERPGQTREELRVTTELSSASVAQNLRRLIEQGQVEERALPDGGTGFALPTSTSEAVERQGSAGGEPSPQAADVQASTPSSDATPPEAQPGDHASADAGGESPQPRTDAAAASSPPRSRRGRAPSTRPRAKRAAKPTQSQTATAEGGDEPAATDGQEARDTSPTDTPESTGAAS